MIDSLSFTFTAPPMSGPPLHVHTREDELFYVLEGEVVFQIADQRILAKVGYYGISPARVGTYISNFTGHTARLLIMVTPRRRRPPF